MPQNTPLRKRLMNIRQSLEQTGVAMSQMPSGIPRKRYYTPDGREEWKTPQYRTRGTFSTTEKDKDGKPRQLGSEVYDIFLDQGYSLTEPEHLKPYCEGCDKWHDTQVEVVACVKGKKERALAWDKKANAELKKEQVGKDKRIAELEEKIDKLTKLMEAKLGTLL